MDDFLLRKLAELKAKQQTSLDEPSEAQEPEGLAALGLSPMDAEPSESETEEVISDPHAPEDVRRAAIQRVRSKYLGN